MCSTGADDALMALEAALDAMAAEDPAVDDATRLGRVRRLSAARNRLDAQLTGAVRDAENHQSSEHDGLKSMRSWLRTHTRLPDPAARRLIDTGRALSALPAAEAAFVSGLIGADQVAAIAPIAAPERLERAAAAGGGVAAGEGGPGGVAPPPPHPPPRAAGDHHTPPPR